ncbi:MAG: response regulator transcription factor [Saprospiraceae bacterium]|nr:response regulator transcription factor [Saprospiraceae bacterium]
MNKAEILIIDDEPQIRKLLTINLENHDYKVVQATNGKEGIALAAAHPPDLIILDLGLPDINGQEVLKELRSWFTSPIIILSVLDGEDDIVIALDHGAADYLTKPFRSGELLARIRSAIRRNQNSDQHTELIFKELKLDLVARQVWLRNEVLKLTSTEYNLLLLFAKNEGKVLTHRFLLREIWGASYVHETQYLRVFVAALRKKIEANPNKPEYIITESGVGYRFL